MNYSNFIKESLEHIRLNSFISQGFASEGYTFDGYCNPHTQVTKYPSTLLYNIVVENVMFTCVYLAEYYTLYVNPLSVIYQDEISAVTFDKESALGIRDALLQLVEH